MSGPYNATIQRTNPYYCLRYKSLHCGMFELPDTYRLWLLGWTDVAKTVQSQVYLPTDQLSELGVRMNRQRSFPYDRGKPFWHY